MFMRLLKIFLFALAGFVLLLILIGGLTQTRKFKNWLRDKIVQQAAAALSGKLHLGRIEGNLVSRFGFRDICIELDGDTLLYVPHVEVGLSPLELLQQQVLVSNLIFRAPQLHLKQRPDSTWNLAHLVKSTPPNGAPSALNLWRIALQNLEVDGGALAFAPLDASYHLLPRRIQNLSTTMRLDYADRHLNVMLKNLRLTSVNPPMQLDSLAAQVFWGGDSLGVKKLTLRSEKSRLAGQIALRHLSRPIYDVELSGAPLHLEDLRAFFPQCPVTGPVRGSLRALGDAQNVRTTFQLEHLDGLADGNFFALRDSATTYYNLDATVRALHLNPYWPNARGLTRLNFNVKLDGSGLSMDDLNANLLLKLDSSQALGREVSQLRLTAEAREQQIRVQLSARAPAGELNLSGKLSDPQNQQLFELSADGQHINFAKLFQNDTLDSDVSFQLAGAGQYIKNPQRKFDGWLRFAPSRVPAVLIDSAYCQFRARGAAVQLDTLHLASSMGSIQAGGILSWQLANNFRFRAELGDLTWIKRAVEADTLRAAGIFSGVATGPLDSLVIGSRFDLRRVQYDRNAINKLTGNLTFRRVGNEGGGFIQLRGDKMALGVVPVDSGKASVYYDLRRAQISANFWQGEKNTGELEGFYTYGDTGRFDVGRCEINVLGQTWRAPKDRAMWIDIDDDDYDFQNCVLSYENQRIYLDGRLSYFGAEDLRFKIEGVDLAALLAVLRPENPSGKNGIAGILDGHGHLTGTADKPILTGHLNWSNGRVADFIFEKWEADFGYRGELFSWQFRLHQNQDRFLTGEGYLPMNLSLNNTGDVLYRNRPMRIQAGTTGIDLAFLQTLTDRVKQVQGTLVFDVKLENTLKRPRSKGAWRILDGAFSVPEYGVTYNDVQLAMSIDTSSVKLIDLQIRSDKGELNVNGQVDFTREKILTANASLTAKDFLVMRNRNLELRLNANLTGTGDEQGPRYRGDIVVVRSRFFLEALQQRAVIELTEAETKPAAVDTARAAIAGANGATPLQLWLQRLRGEIKINIPRNTWIRGPELNAEIDGAVDFIQEGMEKFLPFGTLYLVRGTYELFGKRFDIDKGQITFQGDLHNPQFDLTARHVFRAATGDREKKSLEVKISGELANPKIEFQQEGESLDEKDALANLIFGVNFDELFYSQREDLTNDEGSALSTAAMGLVSGLVSQELARSLGRSLNLDLIEFQSGEDITKSSVLVGKYLTNDLFISFGQEPNGRVVSLEWELLKFLFLQAAHGGEENRKTGFDLIWKLDW